MSSTVRLVGSSTHRLSYLRWRTTSSTTAGSVHIPSRNFHGPPKPNEYTEVASYPELRPLKRDKLEQENLSELVKNLKTVEEKQYYMNKPKYFGWYSTLVDAHAIQFGSLPFVQFATNTTLVEKLPDCYGDTSAVSETSVSIEDGEITTKLSPIDIEAKKAAEALEPFIKEFILKDSFHFEHAISVHNDRIHGHEAGAIPPNVLSMKGGKRKLTAVTVRGINRIIHSYLSTSKDHLMDSVTDHHPRLEAFIFRGGVNPSYRMVTKRKGVVECHKKKNTPPDRAYTEDRVFEKLDMPIQIFGDSILQLRCEKMISPFIENYKDSEICKDGPVPQWNYEPKYSGYPHKHQNGTNVGGPWTFSSHRFGHLNFVNAHNCKEMMTNELAWSEDSIYNDRESMLLTKAVLNSFSVLMPNACYQGFSPLNDPTHPFTTQTVVTDGKNFKFCSAQLNTTNLLEFDDGDKRILRNVVWHLPEQQLYSSVDEHGVRDFNRNVLETLIKFYLMEPSIREADIDNTDYLGPTKYIHRLRNTYNREFFTSIYKDMYSKRPPTVKRPEILPYQRLYMINHPELMSMCGNREQPWFKMAQIDFKGKENWHPEFRHADKIRIRKVKKFQKHKYDTSVKIVTPPLPEVDEED